MTNPIFNYIASRQDDIQKNVIGLKIELLIREGGNPVSIASATEKWFIFEKPDATSASRVANFVNDGSDGRLYYTTMAGDLNQAGVYQVQAYIGTPTFNGNSTVVDFTVNDNLT